MDNNSEVYFKREDFPSAEEGLYYLDDDLHDGKENVSCCTVDEPGDILVYFHLLIGARFILYGTSEVYWSIVAWDAWE